MNANLTVWWIPQVPMEPFKVNVESPKEARKILETLAAYDLFQLRNNIKPDFSNAGGLLDGDEDWEDELGNDIWEAEL